MDINIMHCFLVHPAKHDEDPPAIGGTRVTKKNGRLYTMLKGIFDKTESDCKIDISFNHNSDGKQQNDCRDLVLSYMKSHKVADGRIIASRLQRATTQKSGLGLLFIMLGKDDRRIKIVLSRFPADQGILAEEGKDSLTVEFLEKVFMKSATAYKAAVYTGKSVDTGFWAGRAVDKQINDSATQIANYWIRDFLASDLRTTGAAGSKRLAVALRTAMNALSDAEAKAGIAAAVTLASSISGQTTSGEGFCQQFGLSTAAINAVRKAVRHENLMKESFRFDISEFKQHIAFRSVELDTGGMLVAESSRFDEIFSQEPLGQTDEVVRFTTEGKIVNQRLRKSKV